MLKFIKQIFQEQDGKYSHKRLITILAFLVMIAAFVANTFFGIPISEFLIDNFMYIILIGMGITATAEVGASLLGRIRSPK